ncbi:MAG TPA: aspartate--tRNA ligase [Ignavibacteria bacterium]
MKFSKRTHNCGELNLNFLNHNITLNGWVAKKRDLGGLIFVDIRDRYGITQIKFNSDSPDIYNSAEKLGNEFVISVSGKVIKRESINKNIPTGEIEIEAVNLEILNESDIPPFVVEEDVKASEELRLTYRYLDLRRKSQMENMIIRNKVYQIVHKYYENLGFLEVETPILMKSTPEGARDYLVPSRVHKGQFYALPQSPQTYKQVLMVAGLDKYVQICKCFRDEDLRADRQPEFTQIDVEMSFVDQGDVFEISEGLYKNIWKDILKVDIEIPFKRMTYDEAISIYGIDKPDLRIIGDLKISEISNELKNTDFKIFREALEKGGIVAGIKLSSVKNVKNQEVEVTRKVIDMLNDYVKTLGFGGLGYVKINADGTYTSPLTRFIDSETLNKIKNKFGASEGDTIFILSGTKIKVLTTLGQLRSKIANDFNLIDETKYEFLWITDFPLFRYEEEDGRFYGEHHVFTMPKDEYIPLLDSKNKEEIESIRANCYDLVLNGNEIGSGSIRIHKADIQQKVFNVIGLTEAESSEKFGFILKAFKYGAPPHGGIAFGFDRIIAVLCGLKSIRDVIAFPKTISASSLMDDTPSTVTKKQLDELGISINSGFNNKTN